ncbi:MAG: hypothetical protein EH225_00720 [Calditrichaeota bacterium]|nr:MAG: hypothetical protein EH225_00720 [Calditrichota bacterium]
MEIDIESYLEEMRENNPDAFLKLMQEAEMIDMFNSTGIQQRMFYAYNFVSKKFYTVNATLRREGALTRIWVEDASDQYMTETLLDNLLANLESFSGANSIDPTKGIVEIDTMLFGQPPNYDGDGIVDFLVLDIKDSYSPDENNEFIAGYFSPTDQTNQAMSNKMDLMYLDSYPGFFDGQNYRTEPVLSTTAHEFQHLIHYNYDQNEELWINEGLSQLAGTYCGYGIDFPYLYLENPNQSLTVWEQKLQDYSRANLWTLYCAEQLGLEFIKNLTQNPSNGIASFNESLQFMGSPASIADVFRSWTLANLINDRSVDPRYGYIATEASGLRASVTRLVYQYPETVTGIVKGLGVEYHRFRGRDSLQFNFAGTIPQNYWLVSRNNLYSIASILQNSYHAPFFSDDSTYILLLYSTVQDMAYRYDSYASFSLRYFDMVYDDGQTDVTVRFDSGNLPAVAANRFIVPENNLDLESVRFWSASSDYNALIRVLSNNGSQLPGTDLISPLNIMPESRNNWVEIPLPEKLSGLRENEIIYVAVEINEANKAIGYDNTLASGRSYLKLSGNNWSLLSNYSFSTNNEPASGLWMIRASFSGLIQSDSISDQSVEEDLIVLNNFPNPFVSQKAGKNGNGTHFSFQIINPGYLRIAVYDILGRKVHEMSRQVTPEGRPGSSVYNAIFWDGYGENGPLAAGIYIYRLTFLDAISGKRIHSPYRKLVILN